MLVLASVLALAGCKRPATTTDASAPSPCPTELDVSILSQRRGPYPPYGLAGGASGAVGRNVLLRADGNAETLPNQAQFLARPGDVLVIETPGGGGYGAE